MTSAKSRRDRLAQDGCTVCRAAWAPSARIARDDDVFWTGCMVQLAETRHASH
ncbi:MAG: hypothetical protein LBV60_16855 [Streptomyces sp.]|nr:hypothetical protein [Streptomyces sp.]